MEIGLFIMKELMIYIKRPVIFPFSLFTDFPQDRFMQGKGNIFWWQCKNCNKLEEIRGYEFKRYTFKGESCRVPECRVCKKKVRPNINLKNDLDWIEDMA